MVNAKCKIIPTEKGMRMRRIAILSLGIVFITILFLFVEPLLSFSPKIQPKEPASLPVKDA